MKSRVMLGGSVAKTRYAELLTKREAIDAEVPGLEWRERPEGVECYIDLSLPANPDDTEGRQQQFQWLATQLEKLQTTFQPHINELS